MTVPEMPPEVAAVLDRYPAQARVKLLELRKILFEEAERLEVGALQETLKWGEPAYLTPISKAGSTIRMAWKPKKPETCSLFFSCNTDLIARMRETFPVEFQYVGNREVSFPIEEDLPDFAARAIVGMALTYHRAK